MKWIEVKDVIPGRSEKVLLGYFNGNEKQYALGELGGCNNAPTMAIDKGLSKKVTVSATHWCRLVAP